MSVHRSTAEVAADLTLRVPRGDSDSLGDGVRTVLAGIDAVCTVEVVEIAAMRPDTFDIYVDATARIELAADEPAAALADGFGVVAVNRCEVD